MVVEIKNLVKRYGDFLAVDNISLSIEQGEIFGLLGPNGAGKTTAINCLIGMQRQEKGQIILFGKNFDGNDSSIKKDIGIVPQDLALYLDLTCYENVTFFAKLYGLKDGLLKSRVQEALEFTGLWDRRKDLAKKLSGGMKRRLNIACAIVHQPKLIIMDEPTVGIDPQSRNHILQSVKELNRKGSSIIYTSHYMEEVEELCSRIAIMDHGKVIAQGTKEELKTFVTVEERIEIELSSINYTLVDNVKQVSGVKECTFKDNKLMVVSEKNSKNLSRIIDCIAATEVDILSMNIEKPTLETVFLTLTGRTLRD
ncbi:MAG: transporter ATP-binding protein [Clostridia bacterium]|nr:transporter ATP-binding protein [Clostridia bacterium]